ncbi:hypothetical protein [Brumimicrobium oceani]|uniref:Uncharacterized protein n=1 Tax=Brumimicrobium oceani TaxID=2100725 RepID=A0A2U2XFA6_9FLAO|nr:hypothetical protein [Brumimicrobium oceani]PWH86475.1 hypothetical protein DIT68_04350 [Brumimicrobium oceani]
MELTVVAENAFEKVIRELGFLGEEIINTENALQDNSGNQRFYLEEARSFGAKSVFFISQSIGEPKPMIYFYDWSDKSKPSSADTLAICEIQNQLWNRNAVPLAIFIYDSKYFIVNCKKTQSDLGDVFLNIPFQNLAIRIKSGTFWTMDEMRNEFDYRQSSVQILKKNVDELYTFLKRYFGEQDLTTQKKLIVNVLLLKLMEEKYLEAFSLVNPKISDLGFSLDDINSYESFFKNSAYAVNQFNYEYVNFDEKDKIILSAKPFADFRDQLINEVKFWNLLDFKYLSNEAIGEIIYHVLFGDSGKYLCSELPSTLLQVQVEEALPFSRLRNIDLSNYRILIPAIGSTSILVLIFRRLIQLEKLKFDVKNLGLEQIQKVVNAIICLAQDVEDLQFIKFIFHLSVLDAEVGNGIKSVHSSIDFPIVLGSFFDQNEKFKASFDLVIGNPVSVKSLKNQTLNAWEVNNKAIELPATCVSEHYISNSFFYLKQSGYSCLFVNGSKFLFDQKYPDYHDALFIQQTVLKIFNFVQFSINGHFGSEMTDSATSLLLIRNDKADCCMSLTNLVINTSKLAKEHIAIECDTYDIHLINKQTEVFNPTIWKSDLLGGGKVRDFVEAFQKFPTLGSLLFENQIRVENESLLGLKLFDYFKNYSSFNADVPLVKMSGNELHFLEGLLIITKADQSEFELEELYTSFRNYLDYYIFYISLANEEILVKEKGEFSVLDFLNLPFIQNLEVFQKYDTKMMLESLNYQSNLLRLRSENQILQEINKNDYLPFILNYSEAFTHNVNSLYGDGSLQYKLSKVMLWEESFIAVLFQYTSDIIEPELQADIGSFLEIGVDLNNLKMLNQEKIVRLYPTRDSFVIIKPNQYKYWLVSSAYRDFNSYFI